MKVLGLLGWLAVNLAGAALFGDVVMFAVFGAELAAGVVLFRAIRRDPNWIAPERTPLTELADPDRLVIDAAPVRKAIEARDA